MTVSYSNPLVYGSQKEINNIQDTRTTSTIGGAFVASVAVGGAGGLTAGIIKNPYISKKGEITDTFARSVYENVDSAGKEAYKESLNILKEIDKVKTPEELKTLFNNNKKAAEEVVNGTGESVENFLEKINNDNLKSNKNTIKEKIKATNNSRFQDMKNRILSYWDKDKKKFISTNTDDEVFKAIKKSRFGIKAKTIAKYTAIGALAAGVIGVICTKLLAQKNS